MTQIGVVSDTHRTSYDPALAEAMARALAGVDMILHAGDLTNIAVLDMLDAPQVVAVHGNMCDHTSSTELPARRIVSVEGKRIGLVHGWGARGDLPERVLAEFRADQVDCVVFGHSHQPTNLVREGVLLFNPGAAAHGLGGGTVGLLTVDREITGRIIEI